MTLDARGGLSVAELIVYFPALVVAIIICSRHGFTRSAGWVFTLILCVIRILGACCELALPNNFSNGLVEATVILDSIGVSPLLLATLGLTSRFIDSVNVHYISPFGTKHLRVVQLLITVGLILSIVGGTSSNISTSSSSSSSVAYQPATTSKVGIILYILAYAGIIFVFFVSLRQFSICDTSGKRIATAVFLALPLILVRLVYSVLSVFVHDSNFNVIDGSVVVLAVMAVIEEFLVVLVYLTVGFFTEPLAARQRGPTSIEARPWKAGREREGQYKGQGQGQGQSVRGVTGMQEDHQVMV